MRTNKDSLNRINLYTRRTGGKLKKTVKEDSNMAALEKEFGELLQKPVKGVKKTGKKLVFSL